MIACVQIPYFAAAVERRAKPSLAAKPLVIVGESQQVWAISHEAAQASIRPGMSLRQSRALCPEATLLPADSAKYQNSFNDLVELCADFSDRIEPDRNSHLATILYMGLEPFRPRDQLDMVQQFGQAIRDKLGLESALGLTLGKFPAFLAARSIGPNRYLCLTPGQEASFLAPFPVAYLPLDADLTHRFRLLGLDTLGQLAKLPAGAVLTQFGQPGKHLHKLARGEDDRPVLPYPPPPAEEIARHLDGPVADRQVLAALCQIIATELAARLAAREQMARVICLTLALEDGTSWKQQRILRQPVSSGERLGLNLNLFLEQAQIACGVEAVTVGLADLIPLQSKQLELFNPIQVKNQQRLNDMLPTLAARYGPRFYEVMLTNPHERLPEQRFALRARR